MLGYPSIFVKRLTKEIIEEIIKSNPKEEERYLLKLSDIGWQVDESVFDQ